MGNPAAEFAALMSGAAAQAAPPAAEAPYGYTHDRETGELRPKKVPGRPRTRPPSVEELKAAQDGSPEPGSEPRNSPPPEDRAPDEKARRARPDGPQSVTDDPAVPYSPGRIAKGMNKLYRRAGRVVKAFDPALGEALIEATRKEDDDDITVGEAWDEVARTNPRIRRFLMRLIAGGAWGQLAAAHAPILLAVLMKPAILKRIPFSRLIEALADDSDDQGDIDAGESPVQDLLGGLTPGDMQQMMGLAQGLAVNFRSRGNPPVPAGLAPPLQEAA